MNEKPFYPYKYKNPGPKQGQTHLEHYYPVTTRAMSLLDPSQQAALDAVLRGENVFLTGPGGCGKSYTIGQIIARLRGMNKYVLVASSTGVSAVLLGHGATTIHTLFNMGDVGDREPQACARAHTAGVASLPLPFIVFFVC